MLESGTAIYRSSGAIAQLGEHLLCKQGVVGSIPTGSTNSIAKWHRTTLTRATNAFMRIEANVLVA